MPCSLRLASFVVLTLVSFATLGSAPKLEPVRARGLVAGEGRIERVVPEAGEA